MTAGVSRNLYDKYDLPGVSKAKITRFVFSDLQERGEAGWTAQRKVVEELCRMTKPSPDAPDEQAGRTALAELKHEATASKILVDPEKAAAPSTPSRSPGSAAAPAPAPTSPGAPPKERPPGKSAAASSDTSPANFTGSSPGR
jgi:hypothetical protein